MADPITLPCRCGLEYPPGLCPHCDRPAPGSTAGIRSLRRTLELHRRDRRLRRCSPRPLLDALADLAFERAVRGEREAAEALFEEGWERSRAAGYPGDRWMMTLARVGHLCRDWEEMALEGLDEGLLRLLEWRSGRSGAAVLRRLEAYRAVLAARLGRYREARGTVRRLLKQGVPPDVRLRLAEALLWCGHADRAGPMVERLLRGRSLDMDDRHLAYALLIDCAEGLGDREARRRWTRLERAWCRRHGRVPYGPSDGPTTAAASWIAASSARAREPVPPALARRVVRLREALDEDSASPQALRLFACRSRHLEVQALERLQDLDGTGRRETLEFVRLFQGRLDVGPLLLSLGPLPEARPDLEAWLEDPELGPYAQRALRQSGTARSLEKRAMAGPGTAGSVRAAAALGSLSGRAAGLALRRLLRIPGLEVPAALGLADRAEAEALPALLEILAASDPSDRPWLALAAARLERGEGTPFDWRVDFLPDPARSRHRLMSHPVEEYLRGYGPVEFAESRMSGSASWEEWLKRGRRLEHACEACGRRDGRPPGAALCLCDMPRVRRWLGGELRRWASAGARSLEEVQHLLEDLDLRHGPFTAGWDVALPLRASGGLSGPRALATGVRWLLARGVLGLEEAARSLRGRGSRRSGA